MSDENRHEEADSESHSADGDQGSRGPVDTELDTSSANQLIEELTADRDDFKDRLLRKQAEFENYKKRTDRERSDFVKFAASELMGEVLSVVDSFELALAGGDSEGGEARAVRQGFELIYKQLLDNLKRCGLEPIEVKGLPFDPNVHEAISTQPGEGAPEGTVIGELRRGYLLHGKLLRPAMVIVAQPPGAGPSEEDKH